MRVRHADRIALRDVCTRYGFVMFSAINAAGEFMAGVALVSVSTSERWASSGIGEYAGVMRSAEDQEEEIQK